MEVNSSIRDDDPYRVFHHFHEQLNRVCSPNSGELKHNETPAAREWLAVKKHFMLLEEWFNDRTLYHLVGYLIHQGDSLLAIKRLGTEARKKAFERELVDRIFRRLFMRAGVKDLTDDAARRDFLSARLVELDYERNSAEIRGILLLFNIISILNSTEPTLRFPFDFYKQDKWDIEHVRSVESGRPHKPDLQRAWLKEVSTYLSGIHDGTEEDKALRTAIDNITAAESLDVQAFDDLYPKVLKHFGEQDDDSPDNTLGNLALLDASTNRSYKNAVFPIKRKSILALDKRGNFLPLATRNLFLKCYSRHVGNMYFWTSQDAADYRDTIIDALSAYFSQARRAAP